MKNLVVFSVLMAVLLGSCDIMTSSSSSSSLNKTEDKTDANDEIDAINKDTIYSVIVENHSNFKVTYVLNGETEVLLPKDSYSVDFKVYELKGELCTIKDYTKSFETGKGGIQYIIFTRIHDEFGIRYIFTDGECTDKVVNYTPDGR